ncbi:MAG TPA: dihydropteroate synthase [Blastocatellia bacterium]|nr:dihydropteroate synthase [Blastocatellia bacterium]
MRKRFTLKLRSKTLELGRRTLIMGVLNVTPDSFSDGGLYYATEKAVERALQIEAEGADILDIGGESTRPSGKSYGEGERYVSAQQEQERILPVLEALRGKLTIPISVDTYKGETAGTAIKAGAEIINDISGLKFDPEVATVAAESGVPIVLMHTRGRPEVMQKMPPSSDIFSEIASSFNESVREAERLGVSRDQLILDPGIGFGKTVKQNFELINHLDRFETFNLPLLVGPSRKSFLAKTVNRPANELLIATSAAVTASVVRGAHIVRVHDVRAIREACDIVDAITVE